MTCNYFYLQNNTHHMQLLHLKKQLTAFFNGELEEDIRAHGLVDSTVFMRDSDREKHMDRLADNRRHSLYPHSDCSKTCRK